MKTMGRSDEQEPYPVRSSNYLRASQGKQGTKGDRVHHAEYIPQQLISDILGLN